MHPPSIIHLPDNDRGAVQLEGVPCGSAAARQPHYCMSALSGGAGLREPGISAPSSPEQQQAPHPMRRPANLGVGVQPQHRMCRSGPGGAQGRCSLVAPGSFFCNIMRFWL